MKIFKLRSSTTIEIQDKAIISSQIKKTSTMKKRKYLKYFTRINHSSLTNLLVLKNGMNILLIRNLRIFWIN